MYVVICSAIAVAAAYYYYTTRPGSKRRRHSLRDKLILITGGGSGIGAELAFRLATMEDAVVLVADIDEEGMSCTAERIKSAGGQVSVFPCDVSDKTQMTSLIQLIESRGRHIDVLVNNAGIAISKSFLESSDEELEKTFRINLFSHFYAIRAVLPNMIKSGGHIVEVGSTMDSLATAHLSAYTASKWAVAGFSESLRQELYHTPVRLTLVRPWILSTPMFDKSEFFSHRFAPSLLPATSVVQVADEIIDALVHQDRAVVTVPKRMLLTSFVFHLIPANFRCRVIDALGLANLSKRTVNESRGELVK